MSIKQNVLILAFLIVTGQLFCQILQHIRHSEANGLQPDLLVMRRDPSDVIKVGAVYYVWYSKRLLKDGIHHFPGDESAAHGYSAEIWYAVSKDGRSWEEKGRCVAKGTVGAWDEQSVFTPNILVFKKKYYLFYTGVPKPFTNVGDRVTKSAIGLAVSDSPGGPWKKIKRPVLACSADSSDFDSMRIDDACLVNKDGKIFLYYKGRQWGHMPSETKMGLAIADDPAGPYRKHDLNPLIKGGHEVMLWPVGAGVMAMINIGPEGLRRTIQYAPDGIHFNAVQGAAEVPAAAGFYREEGAKMPEWGVEIAADKDRLPGLGRFDMDWGKTAGVAGETAGASKPNVLVILTDDQRYSTIHALGNEEIITPNMDKLVREGTAFTQAHIQGGLSGAICCPSRAMLMSSRGLFHLRRDGAYVPSTDTTFPELFRANGYITFETGKWHQDKACYNRSFTTGDNIMFGGMNPPETGGQYRPRLHHYDSSGQYKTPFWGEDFSSIYFADAAVDFLHRQQDSRQPFLMYVAFTSPHDPRTPPTWYGHSYRPEDVSLPADYLPEHPFDNGELVIRDETLLPFPRPKNAVRTEIAKYYSMISEVDYQIGRILDALKQTGRDKNTIIVFAGDNGLAVGEHGLLGKQNPYECSIRVPLVFAGKGVPAGKRINGYVYLNDIYPTLCEMAGLTPPRTVEGQSMAGAFGKKGFKGRDHVFFAYLNLQRAVVKDDFKLVRYNVNGQDHLQLFDLKADPSELRNLADQKAFGHVQASLTALLSKTMKEEGDFCDPDKPGWGAPKKWTPEEVMKLHP
ncbi:MAG TPA: sulfatase-like hydrolase/transferase [Puia sp.]|nr:sulfatase-like hydrolase/transferase [Puia sp.]